MKLTTAQLKHIIAEEIKKAQLSEIIEPKDFYSWKADKLEKIVIYIEKINDVLSDIEMEENHQPNGNVAELQSLHVSLDVFEENVTSLIDEVQELM